jgi:hypothetical protein
MPVEAQHELIVTIMQIYDEGIANLYLPSDGEVSNRDPRDRLRIKC